MELNTAVNNCVTYIMQQPKYHVITVLSVYSYNGVRGWRDGKSRQV